MATARRIHRSARRLAEVGIIDVAAFAVMAGVCAIFFVQGGAFGLLGAAIGAAAGLARARTVDALIEAVWSASMAGLWGGMMLGGMFAGLFIR